MKIGNNTVVSFQYLLRNDQQEALDSSSPDDPLVYLHGNSDLIPGLERELHGKGPGDEFSVVIESAEGYGDPDPELIQQVNAKEFSDVTIEPGMQLEGEDTDMPYTPIMLYDFSASVVCPFSGEPSLGWTPPWSAPFAAMGPLSYGRPRRTASGSLRLGDAQNSHMVESKRKVRAIVRL